MSKSQQTYKSLAQFAMNCVNTAASVLKVMLMSKGTPDLPKPNGDRVLVLGNGPSLNDSLDHYPEYFHAHTLMCVNRFAVSHHYTTFKPGLYVIIDPNFWISNQGIITEALDAIREKTTWHVDLLVPHSARNTPMMKELEAHPFLKVHYINYVVFKGFPSIAHFFYRKNMAMMQSRNVLIAAIFMAINLGYKRIELFGADHSWHEQIHVDDNNIVNVRMVHFYDNEEKVTYIPFKKGLEVTETHRMDETFDVWARVFRGYHLLKDYASSVGCTIYNASEKSYVDAFERIRIKK